jgi:hypothetical protein
MPSLGGKNSCTGRLKKKERSRGPAHRRHRRSVRPRGRKDEEFRDPHSTEQVRPVSCHTNQSRNERAKTFDESRYARSLNGLRFPKDMTKIARRIGYPGA